MTTKKSRAKAIDFDRLAARLAKAGYIGIYWHIDDIKEVRPDLTDEQCFQVLERCESHHDAGIGLDWDLIEIHAAELFPESEEVLP